MLATVDDRRQSVTLSVHLCAEHDTLDATRCAGPSTAAGTCTSFSTAAIWSPLSILYFAVLFFSACYAIVYVQERRFCGTGANVWRQCAELEREGGVRAEVSRSYSANPSYEYTLQRQLQRGVRIA